MIGFQGLNQDSLRCTRGFGTRCKLGRCVAAAVRHHAPTSAGSSAASTSLCEPPLPPQPAPDPWTPAAPLPPFSPLYSSPVTSEPRRSSGRPPDDDPEDPDQRRRLNLGDAMLCLREDIPHTLDLDHHMSWHIYRADVAFKLPSGQYFMGLSRYKLFLRSMRLLARLFYSDIAVKLGTVWQPNKNTVWIKWQACGAPRFGGDQLCAEAVSTYKFDSEGKIYEHAIDRIVPPDSPLLGLLNLLARLQWNQQQLPGDEGVVVPGIPGGSSTSNCQQLPPDGSIVPGTRDPQ